MIRRILFFCLTLIFGFTLQAQKLKSAESTISFFSDAAIEDIAATNNTSSSIFNIETGEIAFLVNVTDFQFDKSLMQQHFNEKYLESDKFPKASFKGLVTGFNKEMNEIQSVTAKGTLTIHGESRAVEATGTLHIKENVVEIQSTFVVALVDHKIKIPKLMWQNIAEQVEVKVKFIYQEL